MISVLRIFKSIYCIAFCLLSFFNILCNTAFAYPLPINYLTTKIDLSQHLKTYTDKSNKLSFSEISQNLALFEPTNTDYIIFGNQKANHWTYLCLNYQNITSNQPNNEIVTFYLVINDANLDEVEVFVNGQAMLEGTNFPFSKRQEKQAMFVFPVALQATEITQNSSQNYDIFIRISRTDGVAKLPISLLTKAEYTNFIQNTNYLAGLYYGFLLFTSLIALGLWIVFNEKIYGFYAGYIFNLGVNQFNIEGFAMLFFGDTYYLYVSKILYIGLAFALICFLWFVYYLLYPPNKIAPKYFKNYNKMAGIVAILLIATLFVPTNHLVFKTLQIVLIKSLFLSTVFVIGFYIIKNIEKGNWTSYYFVLSFMPILLIIIAFNLRDSQLIPPYKFLHYCIPIGSAAEIILLFVALLYRLKNLQLEKELVLKKLQALLQQEYNLVEEEKVSINYQKLENITQDLSPYFHNNISEEEVTATHKKLLEVMVSQKPYLDNSLNLAKLAAQNYTTTHQLSQAINQKEGKNFNDFINSYRVEEAKTRLKSIDFQNFTIEAIGQECGFNSKSTFYAAFKKFAGTTPTEFRKL